MEGEPQMVLDSDGFLRHAWFRREVCNPYAHCHRPIIVRDPKTPVGEILSQFKVAPKGPEDDVIDHDVVLLWGHDRRVITGADILGRLMRGIIDTTQNAEAEQPHNHSAKKNRNGQLP